MGYVVSRETVADWDAWKQAFDAADEARASHNARGYTIYRGIDDPSTVIVIREFSRHDGARDFIKDPTADLTADGTRTVDLMEPVDEHRY